MGTHAVAWLLNQYRCVLGRMRAHEFREAHPVSPGRAADSRPSRTRRDPRIKVEQLENRVMLSVTVTGVPDWLEQGPGPITGSMVTGIPNQPVTGAVSAIATHPTNANIIWVGTSGGGIWKTIDGGATWL